MKKIYISLAIGFVFITCGFSQVTFNVTLGISPGYHPGTVGLLVNKEKPDEEFMFNMTEVKVQYFAGMNARLELTKPFFVEFGLNYSKRSMNYQVEYSLLNNDQTISQHQMKESDHILTVPVNLGVKIGAFDVVTGLRVFRSIGFISELDHMTAYKSNQNLFRMGWQGGIGYNLSGTRVGIEFDSQFSRVGNGKSINNHSLELMNIPSQVAFTIQRTL